MPALAASSPIADGRSSGFLDYRLEAYRSICALTPRVSGHVVPDTIGTRAEYEARVLAPMYDEIAQHDPAGVLRHEWLNSRGAIPRFDRDAIEIRVLDTQERPAADLAIAALVSAVTRALVEERFVPLAELQALATDPLAELFVAAVRSAERTTIEHVPLLRALGWEGSAVSAGELWGSLVAKLWPAESAVPRRFRDAIAVILRKGTLSRRIRDRLGDAPTRAAIDDVWHELAACLVEDRAFAGR
jgi:gamma-glutamyl:cysteine ligase YbdK (ATP-grasp superfamily)